MEIPNIMKVFLGLIAIVFMGVVFYFVKWKTPIDKKAAALQNLQSISAEMQEVENKKAEIPRLRDNLREKERELQTVIQQELTPESEKEFVPSYLADVEKLIEQQRARMADPDFVLTSINPEGDSKGSSVSSLSSYPVRTFQMNLTGRYATIIDFLRQLGALKLKRLVTVSKLSLSGSPDKDSYSKSPVLTVQLPVSVYLRKDGSN